MKYDLYREMELVKRVRTSTVGIYIHSINVTDKCVHPKVRVATQRGEPYFVFDIPSCIYNAEKTAHRFTVELRTKIMSVCVRAEMAIPDELKKYKPLFIYMLSEGFRAKTAFEVVESNDYIVRTRLDCDGVHHYSIPRDLLVAHDAMLEGLMLANIGVDCAQ